MKGVILYGPPASGKTSVAEALERLHPGFFAFRRLKAGGGRTSGYRMTSRDEIESLEARGDIIWRNHRYGAIYAIDRSELIVKLAEAVPIVQLGQLGAIASLQGATPQATWYIVSLHCSRNLAAARIEARGDRELNERLAAWDQTEPVEFPDLSVDTGMTEPHDVAAQVAQLVQR